MATKKEGKILFVIRRPKSVLKLLAECAALMILVGVFAIAVTYERPYGDLDWPELKLRSSLSLYIDYGTGCHWIKQGVFGSLVPRLNSHYVQVCLETDFRPPAPKKT